MTSAQFTSAYNAVRPDVNGYRLNIPAQGSACPRCGDAAAQGVAVSLLQCFACSAAPSAVG